MSQPIVLRLAIRLAFYVGFDGLQQGSTQSCVTRCPDAAPVAWFMCRALPVWSYIRLTLIAETELAVTQALIEATSSRHHQLRAPLGPPSSFLSRSLPVLKIMPDGRKLVTPKDADDYVT